MRCGLCRRRRGASPALLDELCGELPLLRQAADPARCLLRGKVARRMHDAVAPFAADCFITPMAAVAGAVAEEILGAMVEARSLTAPMSTMAATSRCIWRMASISPWAWSDSAGRARPAADHGHPADDPTRGVATSGRHGRSFSLGIADAVTVLARTAVASRRSGHRHRQRGRFARTSRRHAPPGVRFAARQRSRRAPGHPRRRCVVPRRNRSCA